MLPQSLVFYPFSYKKEDLEIFIICKQWMEKYTYKQSQVTGIQLKMTK